MNNKKTLILIFGVAALLIGIIIYGYSQIPVNTSSSSNIDNPKGIQVLGPVIKIESPSFDFGTVVYGDVSEHNFIVKNVGTEDLEILRLSTSCGCTKAFINEKDKIIAPGKSVKMRVTFDPAVHKDDSDLGELTRTIYVKSNDPDNSEVETQIKANVIKK